MPRKNTRMAAGIAACLLLASCAAFAAGNSVKLLVGHLPVTGHAKLFVAKERGFFEAEGLDVELIPYSNSADGLAAVKASKLDVGVFGTVAPLVYMAAGIDVRIIGGIMGEDAYLIALPEKAATIGTPADLRGMTVATVRLSSGNAVLRGALRQAGLSWKSDLDLTELSSPEAVMRAVEMGQADAGLIWGPHDLTAVERGMELVMATADLFPGHPCCRIVVMADRFAAKKEVWRGFLRAILLAERFTQSPENREQTISDISKYIDLGRTHIEKSFFHGRLDQASDPNTEGVRKIWNIMRDSEFIVSDLDPGEFVIASPYHEALESLMGMEPDSPYWSRDEALFLGRN